MMTDHRKMTNERITLNQATLRAGLERSEHRHVTYDPEIKPQYQIRRQTAHDGTLLFSIELMRQALSNLINGTSYYKQDGRADCMRYVVGPIKVIALYGLVDVPAGRINGLHERVVIPVRAIKMETDK